MKEGEEKEFLMELAALCAFVMKDPRDENGPRHADRRSEKCCGLFSSRRRGKAANCVVIVKSAALTKTLIPAQARVKPFLYNCN